MSSRQQNGTQLSIDLAGSSHPGHVREKNEDHYLIVRFGRSLETMGTNLEDYALQQSFDVTGYAMFVADGIGSVAGGEVASRVALSRLVELLVDTPDWFLLLKRWVDVTKVLDRMKERFLAIDQTVRQQANEDETLRGMGTTLTIAGIVGNDLILGHIGDSRVYLFRGEQLTQLTTDHTLAQALIQAGITSPEDHASRSMRQVLTAAVGALGESTEPEVQRVHLHAGDCILLCTDGLTDMVDDETISSLLQQAQSAQRACHDLIDLALAGGGRDNITAIVARFGSASGTIESSDLAT